MNFIYTNFNKSILLIIYIYTIYYSYFINIYKSIYLYIKSNITYFFLRSNPVKYSKTSVNMYKIFSIGLK